jgi:hypothetical protein
MVPDGAGMSAGAMSGWKCCHEPRAAVIKTWHFLPARFWRAGSIFSWRVAFPLIFLGAGLALVQPCAAAPFAFSSTGNLANARSTSAAQLTAFGLDLKDPKESGTFTALPPGDFTVILAGKNGGIGIGLVEIYNLK